MFCWAVDGIVQVLNRRERPQLVFDSQGRPVAMTNGAQRRSDTDKSFTLIVPIQVSGV